MSTTLEIVVTHHATGAGTLRLFQDGKPTAAECDATAIALPGAIERYQSLYHVADDHVRHVDKDGRPWQESAQFVVGQQVVTLVEVGLGTLAIPKGCYGNIVGRGQFEGKHGWRVNLGTDICWYGPDEIASPQPDATIAVGKTVEATRDIPLGLSHFIPKGTAGHVDEYATTYGNPSWSVRFDDASHIIVMPECIRVLPQPGDALPESGCKEGGDVLGDDPMTYATGERKWYYSFVADAVPQLMTAEDAVNYDGPFATAGEAFSACLKEFDEYAEGYKARYNALHAAVLTLRHDFTPESLAALYSLVTPAESDGVR
jgi:hypothetical protein